MKHLAVDPSISRMHSRAFFVQYLPGIELDDQVKLQLGSWSRQAFGPCLVDSELPQEFLKSCLHAPNLSF